MATLIVIALPALCAAALLFWASAQGIARGLATPVILLSAGAMGLGLAFVLGILRPRLVSMAKALEEMEAIKRGAQDASALRARYLETLSHDIRTPLNGILGTAELLLRASLSEKNRRFVKMIFRSANTLAELINDQLDFAAENPSDLALKSQEFELVPLLEDILELAAPRAHRKGVEVILDVHSDVPTQVFTDSDRLRQILANLINNAVKFTQDGSVELEVHRQGPEGEKCTLVFEVTDTGIGMSEADQTAIFDTFAKEEGVESPRGAGAGLGLSISREIAVAMGGDISVTSKLGRGSTFTLRLEVEGRPAPPANDMPPTDLSIHFVEGHPRASEVIGNILRTAGFTLHQSKNGNAALNHFSAHPKDDLDVLLIDATLSDMPAERLMDRLAKSGNLPKRTAVLVPMGGTPMIATPGVTILAKPVRVESLFAFVRGAQMDGLQPAVDFRQLTPTPGGGSALRLLVVDDNPINQAVAEEILDMLGYRCDLVSNGVDAIRAVQTRSYAGILMDCQMPDMDGYTTTQKIREWEREEGRVYQLPIIAVTANAALDERQRVLNAGMDDYLSKPIRAAALGALLEQHAPIPAALKASILEPGKKRSQKVVELFIKLVPLELKKIETAADQSQKEELAALAHKIKGTSRTFGATRMAEFSDQLERAVASSDFSSARALVTSLNEAFEDVLAKLNVGSA
jgi:signal transduction histidine kinase/CheY-like chemotaxis protein